MVWHSMVCMLRHGVYIEPIQCICGIIKIRFFRAVFLPLSPSFSLLAATTRQSDLSKDIATSWPYSTYSFCTAHLIIWHLESNWESKFPNLLNCFNLPWPASISDRKFRFVRFAFLALYTSWPRFIFRSALNINAKVGP